MKLETLALRIADKAEAPTLEEAILQGELPSSLDCMVWTGRKTREGLFPRMVRDADGRPLMEPIMQRAAPLIQFNGKVQYVNRLVFEKTHNTTLGRRKLRNLCGESLCVNPNHWMKQPLAEEEQPVEEAIEPPMDEEWTTEEAIELLEMYLTTNETLDREHALLIDIPPDLLEEALNQMGKGHLLDG
tara:strand:+ start:1458 stop:2018 length:561 start_codon:yes stop_codon:yes gene_type:complete